MKLILPTVPVLLGGVHAILYPDDAVRFENVDYVCNCEGEIALWNLIQGLESGTTDIAKLKGICLKDKDGSIIKNEVENLTQDISEYLENRDVYYQRYPFMREDATKFFLGSRGCPFKCSFCFNYQMQRIFQGKGKYIRFKRPERLIEEIEQEMTNGPLKYICFSDDLFTMDKQWLHEFSRLYKSRIHIPFMCQIRIEFADEEVLAYLKDGGCKRVIFGLETGNERLRETVLNKKISNDDIKGMVRMARKYGMQVHTFNIFGIPGETLENSFETVDVNIELGTDIVASSMCIPFPNTDLAAAAIKTGALPPNYSFRDIPQSFHRKSIVRSPDIEKQEKVHKIIALVVKYPKLYPLVKSMINSDNKIIQFCITPVFFLSFLMSFLDRYRGEGNTFWDMVKFIYRFRKSY